MKTNKLPRSAWTDPQATGSQIQRISQPDTYYLSSDYIKKTGYASNDESYEQEISNLIANHYFAGNSHLVVTDDADTTDNHTKVTKPSIDCGYKKAIKEPAERLSSVSYSDKPSELLQYTPKQLRAEINSDELLIAKTAIHKGSVNKAIDIPERVFMNGLIKHTAIALAIIIPLAAFSAYAATPQVLPTNSTAAPKSDTVQPDNAIKTPIAIKPSEIIHKSATLPTAVDNVDLEKYAGTWYEIGRLPMYFQRNCAGNVTATYTGKTDGSGIIVANKCTDKDGKDINAEGLAKPIDNSGSKLKVTFLPSWIRWLPVGRADYWVLARDANYKTALVGTPDNKYLWLLARSPNITQETYSKYRDIAQQQGYDLKEFKLTNQSEQLVKLVP